MLTPRLFDAAAAALRPGGTFTIVTDNAWFADLLLDSLAAHGRFRQAGGGAHADGQRQQQQQVEEEEEEEEVALPEGGRLVRSDAATGLRLVAAPPGPWCRHARAGASSYFDRLWKTGLSVHSAVNERFVLHVRLPGSALAAVAEAAADAVRPAGTKRKPAIDKKRERPGV